MGISWRSQNFAHLKIQAGGLGGWLAGTGAVHVPKDVPPFKKEAFCRRVHRKGAQRPQSTAFLGKGFGRRFHFVLAQVIVNVLAEPKARQNELHCNAQGGFHESKRQRLTIVPRLPKCRLKSPRLQWRHKRRPLRPLHRPSPSNPGK